jgi:hypothetical protein
MDIAAYTYRADLYCPECIVEPLIVTGEASQAARDMDPEEVLDQIAGANAINREDEETFDSDDIPKVAFANQLRSAQDYTLDDEDGGETADRCSWCHTILAP